METTLSRRDFEELVRQALDGLPAAFHEYLEEVGVVVEDAPSAELLVEMGMDPSRDTLFGLYQGTPLLERSVLDSVDSLPARISIYRLPLLEYCRDREELVAEVQTTVVHEIAHHFGFEEERLEELGWA